MIPGNGCGPDAATADLGDLIVVLLAGMLARLRDLLYTDGYPNAADLVGDLVEVADDYVARGLGQS